VTQKAWSGVFKEATDARVEAFTESVSFDRRLYAHDITASIAHAQMLSKVGLISPDECQQIEQALAAIRQEIEQGDFPFRTELEDIHMHVEAALIERLGDVGRKLHTARSRNDQVSTDLRLWVRDAIDLVDEQLVDLQRAFVGRAEGDQGILLPAYTHLRPAQPVLATHYWLCYCEKFERDRGRLAGCRERTNVLALGAAAVAGTSLPIDRQDVARRLDMPTVAANSIDVSSDRDFVIEFAFTLALIAEHLSTWAEEWVLWSTAEFNMLQLPEAFCTGSSIMPQKINPDVLELVRGRTARVIGNLTALLVLIKGLPLAYNRDLQEDKERIFDSFDTVSACLQIAAPLVSLTELNLEGISRAVMFQHLDATTLMEHLIRRGMPQRTAHGVVGKLVRKALERGAELSELELADFQAVDPTLDESVFDVLGAIQATRAFCSYGSTGPEQVAEQLSHWKKKLAEQPVR
jgi:argininosuccinate lyase